MTDVRLYLAGFARRWAVVATLLACGATALAQDRIVLRGSVRVDADQLAVSLADVAQLEGEVAEALGEAVVFEASAPPARPVTISLADVRRRLDERGANLGLLALSGRDCVIRWRSAEPVQPAPAQRPAAEARTAEAPTFAAALVQEPTVRGAIAGYLAGVVFRCDPADLQLTFRESEQEDLARSTRGFELEIRPLASRLSPTLPLLVNFFRGAGVVCSARVTVDVAVRQHVLVVQRYAARGDILDAADLVVEERILEPQASTPLRRLEDAIGKEVRGRLVPGQILCERDTASQVIVARNSEVTIRARHGMFVLRMRGRVLQDGCLGDVVRVQRITDRVELTGIVCEDGEISVDTGFIDREEILR
ncbi:MAG: flagellar basal body P-ring formation protein FlgA [Phycisphaerales bacterium]|nr:flagellar basal body P-ring formation protein FlgA [Phycisphaerales bacterium]